MRCRYFGLLLPALLLLQFILPEPRVPTPYHDLHINGTTGVVENWFGNVKWKPSSIVYPKTLQELQDIIVSVNKTNSAPNAKLKRIRAVGTLHSWSHCAKLEGGLMISTSNLTRVLRVDKDKMTVKAEAGIRLFELYAEMRKHGLALSAIPNIATLSLGGVIAMGAHGTTRDVGTLSSLVVEMEIIDYTGKLITVQKNSKPGTEEYELFQTAVVSLGNIGVIYSVTLQCVPNYNVFLQIYMENFYPKIEGKIRHLMETTPSLFLMLGQRMRVTAKVMVPVSPHLTWVTERGWKAPVEDFVQETLMISVNEKNKDRFPYRYRLGIFLRDLGNAYPSVISVIGKIPPQVMRWDEGEVLTVWKDRAFLNVEYIFPIEIIDEVVALVWDRCEEYEKQGIYKRTAPFFLRGLGVDEDGFLSPTRHTGKHMVSLDFPYQSLSNEELQLYSSLEVDFVRFGGKLNWARRYNAPPHEILKNYPDVDRYITMMKKMDPHGVFSNEMQEELFGSRK